MSNNIKSFESFNLKVKNIKMIEVRDWDNLVKETYNRPYNFQQQDGCQDRGTHHITVPSPYSNDHEMNDSVPEKTNGEEMGVKFDAWLARDPKAPVGDEKQDWGIELFWERNFYPDIHTVANDLFKKGLIEAGDYVINIDW